MTNTVIMHGFKLFPGDKLLLVMDSDDFDDMVAVKNYLDATFVGVEFVIVSGAQAYHMPGNDVILEGEVVNE